MSELRERLLDAKLAHHTDITVVEDGETIVYGVTRGNAAAADLAHKVFYDWLTDRATAIYLWRKVAHDPRKAPEVYPGDPDPLTVFVAKLMEQRQTIHPAELVEEILFALAMELEKGTGDGS